MNVVGMNEEDAALKPEGVENKLSDLHQQEYIEIKQEVIGYNMKKKIRKWPGTYGV